MEEFVTDYGSTIKSRFTKNTKNDTNLNLNIDKDRIFGKGLVCNEEGKNGYVDEFEFKISEIGTVSIGDYNGSEALILNARVASLYGSKRVQLVFPKLKNIDTALELLRQKKGQPAGGAAAPRETTIPVQERPVQKAIDLDRPAPAEASAPKPAAPRPVEEQPAPRPVEEQPAPKPAPSAYGSIDPSKATQGYGSQAVNLGSHANPAPAPAPAPAPVEPEPEEEADDGFSEEEFQMKLDKLSVLKDCGLLGDKEFNAKKLELVSQFFDMTEFNKKIQKLVVLKDSGVLSDKEFEANKASIIKECCNFDTPSLKEYKKSVQKLSFLELGGVITAEECERSKKSLLDDVVFSADDDRDTFCRKLQRLPVLKSCQLITEKEYQQRLEAMYTLIDINPAEPMDEMVKKLTKWPLLVKEKLITAEELMQKQDTLVEDCLNVRWTTTEELEGLIRNMVALRQAELLSEEEFQNRKLALLEKIETIEDYPFRLSVYMVLPKNGLISQEEYERYKQKCIEEIFHTSGSMEEFKKNVGNLLEMQKVGMISEREFEEFKTKLVSEL
ncbi:MAG: hypothetical protein ACI4HQ_03820 [Acetatifactor sp.]